MKSLSCVLLLVVFFAVGCAHNGTSTVSPSSTAPSFHQKQLSIAATAEQSASQSKEVTAEQGPTGTEKVQEEQSPPNSEEGTEDLSDKDLDLDEDLDFLDQEEEEKSIEIWDPIEPFNRAMFHFNDKLYFWILKPAARGYNWIFPEDFRISVRNFFTNLLFPIRFINCFLQASIDCAGIELSRFAMNSTLGLGGLFNPSSPRGLNLPLQDEDTGQTLGVWRLGNGFYLNWPVLGPSSARDTVGLVGDHFLNPITYVEPWYVSTGIKAYEKFNKVSLTLGDYEALKEAAIDPYIAIRDAYVQYRQKLVETRVARPRKQEASE